MDKKNGQRTIIRRGSELSIDERHAMVLEYLNGTQTKSAIWRKYTGQQVDRGKITVWLRKFGYEDPRGNQKWGSFASKNNEMKKIQKKIDTEDIEFENLQLKKRVSQLEKQLEEAEMKAIAFSTMVDIAEKQFSIPIRKKFNTKPLKK